jgi:hypothetical protein
MTLEAQKRVRVPGDFVASRKRGNSGPLHHEEESDRAWRRRFAVRGAEAPHAASTVMQAFLSLTCWAHRLGAMDRIVTRHDLISAINHILTAHAVANPEDAAQVFGVAGSWSPGLFAVIPSERAKAALDAVLIGITGREHPTAGNAWILDEAQSLALIKAAEN